MDIQYMNLLEVEPLDIPSGTSGGDCLIVTTTGTQHQAFNPRFLESFDNENAESVNYWGYASQEDIKSVYQHVYGNKIWGGVSRRGWHVWPKMPEDSQMKRVILMLSTATENGNLKGLDEKRLITIDEWIGIDIK